VSCGDGTGLQELSVFLGAIASLQRIIRALRLFIDARDGPEVGYTCRCKNPTWVGSTVVAVDLSTSRRADTP
jgi:hypothetical protein